MIIKIQKPIEINDSHDSSNSEMDGNEHDDILDEIDMEGDL